MGYEPEKYEKVCDMLKALSNPQRLHIAVNLCASGCNVKKITEHLGVPQSTASSYLAKLRNAGVIKGKRKKNEICYSVADDFARSLLKHIKSAAL